MSINSRLLLELNRSACFLKLLLGFFSLVFADAFLNSRRSTVNHFFGFFQAKTGQLTNSFDRVNFLLTGSGQNNVKLGFLFSGFASGSAGNRSSCNSGSSRNTELLFHCFYELNNIHYAHFSNCIQNIVFRQSHDFLRKCKKWCSTESSSVLLLVADCSYYTCDSARNIVQSTCKLGNWCLCNNGQSGQRFVQRRQRSQTIDLVCTHQLTADGQAFNLERLFLFGKILQQTRSGARIFHRESQNGWANQRRINAFELSAFNSNLRQIVTNNLQTNIFSTSLGTQRRHVTGSDTTIVSQNHRQSSSSNLVDFSDDRLLVFESNCHWISPRFRQRNCRQTHHCPQLRTPNGAWVQRERRTPSAQAVL